MPFAIIVVEKGILIIFAAQNLILEILVVEAVDKIFIRIEVKMLLIGNLSSRETEVRPCLVTKWTRDGGFESCRAESKFIARIVLICKYKYEITIKVLLQLMAHKKATKLTSFYVQKKCSRLYHKVALPLIKGLLWWGGGNFRTSGKSLALLLQGTYYDWLSYSCDVVWYDFPVDHQLRFVYVFIFILIFFKYN